MHRTDEHTTYEQMLELLRRGGINTDQFNDESLRTLNDLYRELEKDVTLVINAEGRVARHARSVKVAIESVDGYELVEIAREFLEKGQKLEHAVPKPWAVSETRGRDELPLKAAERGLREEYGLLPHEYHLMYDPLNEGVDAVDIHESSVYKGVLSVVTIQRFRIMMPERKWASGRVLKDGNIRLHLQWRPTSFRAAGLS